MKTLTDLYNWVKNRFRRRFETMYLDFALGKITQAELLKKERRLAKVESILFKKSVSLQVLEEFKKKLNIKLTCKVCKGTGKIKAFEFTIDCPACKGRK